MNNKTFEQDILRAVQVFPTLKIVGKPGQKYLKGILDIKNSKNVIVWSYSIEIKNGWMYPYRFPVAYEVGGDIPKGVDYHKYNNNSLCIDVETSEILKCRRGLCVTDFIKQELIPHLANQLHKKETGEYISEYRHAEDGIRQYYQEYLGNKEDSDWIISYNNFSRNKPNRNEQCYCGSGKKYKHCHLHIDSKMQLIGIGQISKDFKLMNLI